MPGNQQTLLFDLGQVLLHLRYDRSLPYFFPGSDVLPSPAELLQRLRTDPSLAAFETGRISAAEYYRQFCRQIGFEGGYDRFVSGWNAIFEENRPMIAAFKKWADSHPVYCLTNTNQLHLAGVRSRYPWMRRFRGIAASHEIGVLKPDPDFYRRALERFGLPASACLFIDDHPCNVETARTIGISALHYTSPQDAIAAIDGRLRQTC